MVAVQFTLDSKWVIVLWVTRRLVNGAFFFDDDDNDAKEKRKGETFKYIYN